LTVFGGVSPYIVVFEGDTVDLNIEGLSAGEYTIAVIDAYGCTVMVEVIVDSTLGILRNEPEAIAIYPNLIHSGEPVNLRIFRNVENLTFRIRDLNGKVLQENKFGDLASGQHVVALSKFSAGVYLYEMAFDDKVYTGKLVIQ